MFERTYNATAKRVWQALTNKEQMKQWYFDVSDFQAEEGFQFTFTGENEGKEFVHLCEVTGAIPNRLLRYSWAYRGHEGLSHVQFELTPEGDGTKLVLTHEGLETFPAVADFKRENFEKGWTAILGTSLKKFLEPAVDHPVA